VTLSTSCSLTPPQVRWRSADSATARAVSGPAEGLGRITLPLFLCVLVLTSACSIPRWPVDAPLSSPYGLRLRGIRPTIHRGVDIDVPTGTEVRAMKDGRVRFAGVMRGFGNVVWIEHGAHTLTVYAHLSEIRAAANTWVSGGDVLGLSGATGEATGPHLHFEIWRWGREVDPVPLLGGLPKSGGGNDSPARP
jgi:murein DD-endopeptidase MepM/ murein hydrolase activator NlpD